MQQLLMISDFGPGHVMVALCATVGITLYFFLQARHIERMAMIEKGIIHEEGPKKRPFRYLGLKLGMLSFGLGLGLAVSFVFEAVFHRGSDILPPALMFVFGGALLVASYFVEAQLDKQRD